MTEWTASEMGKKGGASASPAKQAAVRENGKLGGRPALPGVPRQVWVRLPEEVWSLVDAQDGSTGVVLRSIVLDAHKSGWFE